MSRSTYRIFVSSPGDVGEERLIAGRVIERLAAEFAYRTEVSAMLWEREPLLSSDSFQPQIQSPAMADAVVVILWSRLGSPLSEQFKRADGSRYLSGTEYEFEQALDAWEKTERPSLLVYRKLAQRFIALGDKEAMALAAEQSERLDDFLERWFGEALDGTLARALHQFETSDVFEERLESHLRRLIEERLEAEPLSQAATERQVTWTQESPFRGLLGFDARHAPIFFGRTRATGELLSALRTQHQIGHPFVLILGMSGVGKSSLVAAGVVPLLLQPGVFDGIGLWRHAMLVPGAASGDLHNALARALLEERALPEITADGTSQAGLAKTLRDSPVGADGLLKGILSRCAGDLMRENDLSAQPQARLLLVLDQFEELFTHPSISQDERHEFLALVESLVNGGHVFVIAVMRSDIYHRCAEEPALGRLLEGSGQYLVQPMNAAEVGQAIRRPAQAAGLRFEVDAQSEISLDEILQHATAQRPEAVPLLEFTLEQLYEQRDSTGMLTNAAYAALGGLEGALSASAEQFYLALDEGEQRLVPGLLRGLVTLGRGTGDTAFALRVDRKAVAHNPPLASLLDRLTQARLVVLDEGSEAGTTSVRIVHEALLSHWRRFAEWIEEHRDFIRTRDRVTESMARWREQDCIPERLLPEGKPLAEAEALIAATDDLDSSLIEYIDASRSAASAQRQALADAQAKRQRIARVLSGVIGALIGLAVLAGYVAFDMRQTATQEVYERAREQAKRLLAQAGEARANGNNRAALRYLTDAVDHELDTGSRLRQDTLKELYALNSTIRLKSIVGGKNDSVSVVEYSPDLRTLLTGSSDGTVRLWRDRDPAVGNLLKGHTGAVTSADFTADGKHVATGSRDGTARIWSAATGKPLSLLAGHENAIWHVAFDRAGKLVVTTSLDHTARLWDAATGTLKAVLGGHHGIVGFADFSPSGDKVVTASEDGTARLWRRDGGLLATWKHQKGGISSASFSLDGQFIATGGDDGRIQVWNTSEPYRAEAAIQSSSRISFVQFTDANRLVSASIDGSVTLWSWRRGAVQFAIGQGGSAIRTAAWNESKNLLATASDDHVARVFRLSDGALRHRFAIHSGQLRDIAFDSDGSHLVTAVGDHGARVWALRDAQPFTTLSGHTDWATAVGVHRKSERVLSASADKSLRIWATDKPRLEETMDGLPEPVGDAGFFGAGYFALGRNGHLTLRGIRDPFPLTDSAIADQRFTFATGSPDAERLMLAAETGGLDVLNADGTRSKTDGVYVAGALGYAGEIAAYRKDKRLVLWRAGLRSASSEIDIGDVDISALSFAPNGDLWLGDRAGAVRKIPSGSEVLADTPIRLKAQVRRLSLDTTGEKLLTITNDDAVRVWTTKAGQIRHVLFHPQLVLDADFLWDGAGIATASTDGLLRIWTDLPPSPEMLIERMKRLASE